MKLPCMKEPCKDCPFRKDSLKGWLGEGRMNEIMDADSFVCHKKTDLQCSGHMLIKGGENVFVALAKRMGMDTGITGRDFVFNTKSDCIRHHMY